MEFLYVIHFLFFNNCHWRNDFLYTQPDSYHKPKTVSHKHTIHYFNILVCLKISLVTKLSVGTASDEKRSKEGLEMRLCSPCVCLPNKTTTQMQTSSGNFSSGVVAMCFPHINRLCKSFTAPQREFKPR